MLRDKQAGDCRYGKDKRCRSSRREKTANWLLNKLCRLDDDSAKLMISSAGDRRPGYTSCVENKSLYNIAVFSRKFGITLDDF